MGAVNKELKDLKRFSKFAAGQSIEETEAMKSRNTAAFESELGVLGMLGQPGTYDSPVSGGPGIGPGGITSAYSSGSGGGGSLLTPGAPSGSLFKEEAISGKAIEAAQGGGIKMLTQDGGTRKVLDPNAVVGGVSKMPVAQIISRQVAEAKGLTDPSSPFRQTLEQSIKNPILESGAETVRESQRMIKNSMAKGGSARRAALADAQNMIAIEQSNRQVSQQMWQANLQFESWIRDYQRTTVNAAMAFTQGLGISKYTDAMNRASEFMVSVTLPTASKFKQQAVEAASMQKKKNLMKMVLGGAMMVGGTIAAFYTGGATMGIAAQGAGMLGGELGDDQGQQGGGGGGLGNLFGGGGGGGDGLGGLYGGGGGGPSTTSAIPAGPGGGYLST